MADKLIVFSAPSGSGKTTIVERLLQTDPRLAISISATTRPKRDYEIHGQHYYFLSPDEFVHKIDHNEFIEYEEVYPGKFYGTLRSEVQRLWKQGKTVLFDVEVVGGLNLRKQFADQSLLVFVKAPSLEVLAQRLQARGTETPQQIRERLDKAAWETDFANQYDAVIINQDLDQAVAEAQSLVQKFLS